MTCGMCEQVCPGIHILDGFIFPSPCWHAPVVQLWACMILDTRLMTPHGPRVVYLPSHLPEVHPPPSASSMQWGNTHVQMPAPGEADCHLYINLSLRPLTFIALSSKQHWSEYVWHPPAQPLYDVVFCLFLVRVCFLGCGLLQSSTFREH